MRRLDTLTLLTFVWPQLQAVFPRNPPKLLIVGGHDQLWRGTRAANNSIYSHSSRPLVSENGSSPLLRELVRAFAGVNDIQHSDWIGEGWPSTTALNCCAAPVGWPMTVIKCCRTA